MTKSIRNLFITLLITLAAFLSYNNNLFLVTSDKLFLEHQLDSEQLVLDGILHESDSDGYLGLGRYTRPEIDNQAILAHQLYADKNKGGEFTKYKSQFGLQFYFFSFLAEVFDRDVFLLQSFSALLMSFVVALFFVAICREFSLTHAVFFCMPLIISPWVVIFARNLYWVEATWFLPTAITFFFGRYSLMSLNITIIMAVILFMAFLVKFLCGYEYLTTIGLSACVPLAYYTMKYRFGVKRGLLQVVICGICLTLAFLVAASFHAYSLSKDSETPFNDIVLTAKKRLSTENPISLAKEFCKNSNNHDECENAFIKEYQQSLTSNRFIVTAKYFAMPHFLPWIDRVNFNSTDKAILKEIRDKPTLESIWSAIFKISFESIFYIASIVASTTLFLCFTLLVCQSALKRKDSLSLGLLVSIMAPISWFILAKGHSYVHYHMNYILWYLPYIPFGMMLLISPKTMMRSTINDAHLDRV